MKGLTGRKPTRRASKKEPSSQPVYFLSLTVENVRCFGPEQTLDLSDGKGRPAQWTILLGDNGVGKTTLLQSLVSIISSKYFFESCSEWKPHRYSNDKVTFSVSGTFLINAKFTDTVRGQEIRNVALTGYPEGTYAYNLPEYEQVGKANCFGYGAARRMGEPSLSHAGEDDPTASLFDESATLRNAEEWLLQADYAASKPSPFQKRAQERRDRIKEILINLLPDVEEIRFAQLSEKTLRPGVEFKTPYGWVSIKELGLGYKTMIACMVDFASRMFERYPDSANPLAEPAIVLVDEIDLHLHPKWQRSIMTYLSGIFPNTQFIATAHSPLVVQAATDANLALLKREGDHIIIDNNVRSIRGWRVDQVLTSDLFGLESARPPDMDAALAARRQILSKGKMTKKDRETLRAIESDLGPMPAGESAEEIEAMDIIRRAAERLKQ